MEYASGLPTDVGLYFLRSLLRTRYGGFIFGLVAESF